MVFMDGTPLAASDGCRIPMILNNLIASGDVPVMAAVFVDPGVLPGPVEYAKAPDGSPLVLSAQKYDNRTVEYEAVDATYASFLADEILPLIRTYVRVTEDAEGRGLGGLSSGANCAVVSAWERPDQFRKVFAAVGSFPTRVRGVEGLPPRMAREDRKPIRMFLQDSARDYSAIEWGYGAERERELLRVLRAKGYDFRFVFGEGTHFSLQWLSILPDALRWLWRGYS
jgi:enterochelin esterase family protein